MLNDFQTEDMKKVFSSILLRLQEDSDSNSADKDKNEKTSTLTSTDAPVSSTTDISPQKSQKKIKASDFANTTLVRMNNVAQRTKEKIKQKQEKLKEKEGETMQKKPEINKKSQKIGKRNEKIYERAEKELMETKKRLEEKKKKLNEEKEVKLMKELTFKPKIRKTQADTRNIEDFFQYNVEWKNRSNRRIEMKRVELEEKETAELKFAPEIDENSANLVGHMDIKQPIEIRLLERHKNFEKRLEAKKKELAYTFTPTLPNRRRCKILKSENDPDVFTRLFSLSIDNSHIDKSPTFGGLRKNKSFSFPDAGSQNKSLDITFSNEKN